MWKLSICHTHTYTCLDVYNYCRRYEASYQFCLCEVEVVLSNMLKGYPFFPYTGSVYMRMFLCLGNEYIYMFHYYYVPTCTNTNIHTHTYIHFHIIPPPIEQHYILDIAIIPHTIYG